MQSRRKGDIVMVLIEGHEVQVTKDQQRATLASACLYLNSSRLDGIEVGA